MKPESVVGDAKSVAGSAVEKPKSAIGDAKSAAGDVAEKPESAVGDAKSGVGSVADKPELAGPFGVQDNGDVTNATGVQIGQLVDGDPQDLVATSIKDIDAEGNLVKASGSIVGKAELNSQIAGDKVDEAGDKVDEGIDLRSNVDDAAPAVDDAAPSEIGSKVDGAVPDVDAESKLEGAPEEVGSKVDDAEGKLDEAAPTEAGSTVDEAAPTEAGSKVDEAVPTEAGDKLDDATSQVVRSSSPFHFEELANTITGGSRSIRSC